jgi:hypothetical protein
MEAKNSCFKGAIGGCSIKTPEEFTQIPGGFRKAICTFSWGFRTLITHYSRRV